MVQSVNSFEQRSEKPTESKIESNAEQKIREAESEDNSESGEYSENIHIVKTRVPENHYVHHTN